MARRQVLRLWQRKRPNELTIATMTFYPSSGDGRKHRELDLSEYVARVKFHSPILRRQRESDTVDIVPSVSAERGTKLVRVKFASVRGTC